MQGDSKQLQEVYSELQNLKIEEQIAKTRGDIYASIIHDINGPLTVISGFTQVLNQRLNRSSRLEMEDLEFIKDRLRIIARQVGNCVEISRRYLGFLRRQSDESPRVSVNQLFKDLDQLIRVHPSRGDNEFSAQPMAEDIGVKINGTDVIQILLNLTINAFQCTPLSHHVEIGGKILHEPLDLTTFKDGPNDRLLNVESMDNTAPLVKLWVQDNGPGIPAEVLPKIFQPYFTTKGSRQGTGLGLNIVQRLVKEANGALHVHTQVGKSTSFTIYLPAAPIAE